MKSLSTWLAGWMAILGACAAHAAVPGDLDTTFGAVGITRTHHGDLAQADDIAVDALGFVYTAGTSTTAGVVVPVLAKYKPNGALDTSFGTSGIATPSALPANIASYSALVLYRNTLYQMIAADDKLYVYAFNTSGVIQPWFGTGGVASFTVGMPIYPVFDIAQWGNYLGLAASARNPVTGNFDFVTVELTLGGAPVPGFGSGGISYSRLWSGSGARNRLTGLVYQPDGRIVAAGRAAKPGEHYDFVVARFRLDGSPDPSFGLAGFATINFDDDDFGRRVALRRDGRVVIAGSACKIIDPAAGTSYCRAGAAGLLSNGLPDPAFGSGGKVAWDLGDGGVTVTDMILDERERPLIVGQHLTPTLASTAFVLRLKSNGALDGSYLGGGWTDLNYGYPASSNGGIKLYPGSRVVTAGSSMKTDPTLSYGLMTVARHIN